MGKWLALAGIALATGCNYGAGTFHCTDDNQCGAAGRCEPANLCSSPSPTCESGRAYSELSGPRSGQCVEVSGPGPATDSGVDAVPIDARSIDAPPDVPPDATACFGTGIVQICLAEAPSAPFAVSDPTTINTDNAPQCAAVLSGGNFCVLAGTTVTITAALRATGTRPLVLLASDAITSTALIDVGSHRGATPETGAGADPADCAVGTPPGTDGGGAGGSFSGLGGSGGTPNAGAPAATVDPIATLRGGCSGQDGQGGATTKGLKGHGGGAVFLIAGATINVSGGINAAGEGGSGAQNSRDGGGGAGAGGMIGVDAPTITLAGLFLASGGGGGEGASDTRSGNDGRDPSTINAAAGGVDGTDRGGDGGNGSAGAAAGPGSAGNAGNPGQGGGGGGGGGAGLIKVPAGATTTGAQTSPAITP